jgi:hypothetical protein
MSPTAFIPSPAAHEDLPPHLRATLNPVPVGCSPRVVEEDEWVLPDGQNLRKKFTFISTHNGEKLKNERVIINDFGTPMEIAIIKSSNGIWREEFLKTLCPAAPAAARKAVRPAVPMASPDASFHGARKSPYDPLAPWAKASMKAPDARRPQQVQLKTSDWELPPPPVAPGIASVVFPAARKASPNTNKTTIRNIKDSSPRSVSEIPLDSKLVSPPADTPRCEPSIPALSKTPAALPPHLRAMSDPAPVMKEPKVNQDGWIPGAQRKKFTFISTANGEQLKKEKVVAESEISTAPRVPVRGAPHPFRVGSAPARIPAQRPAQVQAEASVRPPALARRVPEAVPANTPSAPSVPDVASNRATACTSAAGTQVADTSKKADRPKVVEYHETSEFLKAMEHLVKQGHATIDVCQNGVVTMRLFSSAVSSPKSPQSLTSSPTNSTIPSSVSKDSKTSDFIKEAIKRLNTMQTMRTVIVGGPADYNRPVDTRPLQDKAFRTMKTTIVGGPADYNRPVDTRPIKVEAVQKHPQRVPSIVLGGPVVYQRQVDMRNVSKKFYRGAEEKEEIIPGTTADPKDSVPLFYGDWPASQEHKFLRSQWRPSYMY